MSARLYGCTDRWAIMWSNQGIRYQTSSIDGTSLYHQLQAPSPRVARIPTRAESLRGTAHLHGPVLLEEGLDLRGPLGRAGDEDADPVVAEVFIVQDAGGGLPERK